MTHAELKAVLAVLDEVRHVLPVNWGGRADAIRDKYRAQLAVLPPEPDPWTPRERGDAIPLAADTPPPDPRDEALEEAEKALEEANDQIIALCSISDVPDSIDTALAAIRAARGSR